ncbi:MAG: hypothetical protein FD126_1513, partial [Elusimicrobia bacterium]
MVATWAASDYDGPGSSAAVTYAAALSTRSMGLAVDPTRFSEPPAFGGRVWAVSPAFGGPLTGRVDRPAYKVWPGESTARHGLLVSSAPNSGASGLLTNTTYYLRVQAIDAGLRRSSWSEETALMTGPVAVTGTVTDVGYSTVTATWMPCPAAPTTLSCSGYVLHASTTNFDGSGVMRSSASAVREVSMLSVSGLDAGSTW